MMFPADLGEGKNAVDKEGARRDLAGGWLCARLWTVMKTRGLLRPLNLLALVWVLFATYVWQTAGRLPERVATHFGVNGVPNGWETHTGYIQFTLLFGTLVPAFVLGTFVLIRLGGGWGLNIRNKEYWLAPERRQETFDFVQRHGVRFAGLLILFFGGVHYMILAANAQSPANLPLSLVGEVTGVFLAATAIWVIILTTHFRKPA